MYIIAIFSVFRMMKRCLCVLAILFGVSIATEAQTMAGNDAGLLFNLTSEGGLPLNGHKNLRIAGSSLELGYAFNDRWSLFVPITGTVALFDKQHDIRRYEPAWTLGLGAGFNLLHTDSERVELVARYSNTLIDPADWEYSSYDVGVRYNLDDCRQKVQTFIGLGVCYYDHTKGAMNNYFNLYAVFGIRFGH